MADWSPDKCIIILEAALAYKAARQNLLDAVADRDIPVPETVYGPTWMQEPTRNPEGGALGLKAKALRMKIDTYIKKVLSGEIPADDQTKRQAILAKTLRKVSKLSRRFPTPDPYDDWEE
jgi:hypothetical protein